MAGFGPTLKNREIADDPRLGRLSEFATPAPPSATEVPAESSKVRN